MKSTPTVRLSLHPSRIEQRGIALLHLAVLPMLGMAAIAVWIKWGCVMVVLLAAGYYWRYLAKPPARGLRLLSDGQWMLDDGQQEYEATLLPGAYCMPWLIVLPLRREDGATIRLRLWPDSADAGQLRRLRVWLRWGVAPHESPQTAFTTQLWRALTAKWWVGRRPASPDNRD